MKYILPIFLSILIVGCGNKTTYKSTVPTAIFGSEGSVSTQTIENTYDNVTGKTVQKIRVADLAQTLCMFQAVHHNKGRIIAESAEGFKVYNQNTPPFDMGACVVAIMQTPAERILGQILSYTAEAAKAVLGHTPYYLLYKLGKREKVKIDSDGDAYVVGGDGDVNYTPDNRTGTCNGELVDGSCVALPPEEELGEELGEGVEGEDSETTGDSG